MSAASSSASVSADLEHHSLRFFKGVQKDAAAKYELISHLGRGAYGEVWAARNAHSRSNPTQKVAIKKICNAFCQATEAKRILRELRILRHLNHSNVVKIREVLRPDSEATFTDIWVVFDFVDLDLRKLIASPQTISVAHVQWIAHQILIALQYLHSAHVLHRDLKPANVLLSEKCEVKLCDFGLARVVDEKDWKLNEQRERAAPAIARQASSGNLRPPPPMSRQMTSHVVTRWYRAPELILLQPYTAAIDVWSFACILAELLTMLPEAQVDQRERCALFPGRSCLPLSPVEEDSNPEPNLDQLNVIFSVIGTPNGSLGWIELPEMRNYLRSLSPVPATPLRDIYPAAPQTAIELLESMLRFEPFERLTVNEALQHRFFDSMSYRIASELAECPVASATIDFEHAEVTTGAMRKLIVAEIAHYTERTEAAVRLHGSADLAHVQRAAPAATEDTAHSGNHEGDSQNASCDAVSNAGNDSATIDIESGAIDDASRPAKKRKRPVEGTTEAPPDTQ